MDNLAAWLDANFDVLVEVAAAQLSEDQTLKAQVIEAVEAFFDGFLRAAKAHDFTPLYLILVDWMEARSAPIENELSGFLPVLATLKQATWQQIIESATPSHALPLIMSADEIYTQAFIYLAHLEAEALLKDSQNKLEKAQQYIERVDKSKTNFIAVAAHELRTPLTLVEGYANMLRIDKQFVDNNPQLATMTDGINQGVKRLRDIISDMIDVSLIELRVLKLYFQPIWLHQLLDALERNLREPLLQRKLNFIIERDTIPQEATFGDHERLLQALMNVVMNAVKFTPDGGTIRISARQLPGFADIMVIDTGIGIAPYDLPHIFGMFSSLAEVDRHSSGKIKFRGGGPGLGLFISKGIIDGHGGTIWAQSPGYDEKTYPGSTFHLMIPMRDKAPDDKIVPLFEPDSIVEVEEEL